MRVHVKEYDLSMMAGAHVETSTSFFLKCDIHNFFIF